ncbi:MAG: DUF4136 domain-containing protein [Phycisphaerales bacterium]|nr:MAG: DUF4136 domain-containing protein [Phycisphaerales bacterium]
MLNMGHRARSVAGAMASGLAVGLLSCGCAENKYNIEVSSAYGPGVKFGGIGTTYDLKPLDEETAKKRRTVNPEFDTYLRETIERGLAENGFVKSDKGGVDFWLDYYVARLKGTDRRASAHGVTYDEGSLLMEVIDPDTRELIWQGAAYARLQASDPPDVREERINIAVRRLMEQFPTKDGRSPQPQGTTGK